MAKKKRQKLRLHIQHDGRPQTMTRQEALKKSLLFLQEWPAYEVLAVQSDEETDRIIIHHRPTGDVVTFIAYFDRPAGS